MLHPDIRGEGPCHRCETINNPRWAAPNTLWNAVIGGPTTVDDPGSVLCIPCFIDLHHTAGYTATGWILISENKCANCKRLFWQVDPHNDTCPHCTLQHAHK